MNTVLQFSKFLSRSAAHVTDGCVAELVVLIVLVQQTKDIFRTESAACIVIDISTGLLRYQSSVETLDHQTLRTDVTEIVIALQQTVSGGIAVTKNQIIVVMLDILALCKGTHSQDADQQHHGKYQGKNPSCLSLHDSSTF